MFCGCLRKWDMKILREFLNTMQNEYHKKATVDIVPTCFVIKCKPNEK